MASKLGSGTSHLLNRKIDEIAPTTGLTIQIPFVTTINNELP